MGKKKDAKRAKKAEKKARKAAELQAQPATSQPTSSQTTAPAAATPTPVRTAMAAPAATATPIATAPPANTPAAKKRTKPEDNREITIGGKKYTMALGFNDLCDGEQAAIYKWKQHGANLLNVHFAPGQLSTARNAFAMSLERFHSDIPFEKRRSLLTWPTLLQAAIHIYPLFYPDKEKPKETTAQ